MDEYLTVDEVAERLRVSRYTVYAWLRAGSMRAIQVGRVWRIPATELDRLANL